MIVLKLLGCILITLSSSYMGFSLSNELKCRIADLKELKKLIGMLRGDIRYSNTALPEAISSIASRHEGKFQVFFTNVSTRLQEFSGITFTSIWRYAVEIDLLDTSLSKTDKAHMIQFGENLGYLDKEMQMNTLDLYINQLEDVITELSKTVKEKTKLYSTLGILGGILITIVLL